MFLSSFKTERYIIILVLFSSFPLLAQKCLLSDYKVVRAEDGRLWLDRNLGANRAAISSDDSLSFGDLYQWGRSNDGHQVRTSLASDDGPVTDPSLAGQFFYTTQMFFYIWSFPLITAPAGSNYNVWKNESDPCPEGFRIPTADEWQNLLEREHICNARTAFSSTLKLPAAGFRDSNNALFYNTGISGSYWSSSMESPLRNYYMQFSPTDAYILDHCKCSGFSVRCIAE